MGRRDGCCSSAATATWLAVDTVTRIALGLALAALITALVVIDANDQPGFQRSFALVLANDTAITLVNTTLLYADSPGWGGIDVNRVENRVELDMLYDPGLGTITAVSLYGPANAATSGLGPLAVPLCGPAANDACDLASVPFEIQAKSSTAAYSNMRTLLSDIQTRGHRYTLVVHTLAFPSGAAQARLV